MKKKLLLLAACWAAAGAFAAPSVPAEAQALLLVDVPSLRASPFGQALEARLRLDPEFNPALWEGVKELTLFAAPSWYAIHLEGGNAAALKAPWAPEEDGAAIVLSPHALLVVQTARSGTDLKTALAAASPSAPQAPPPALLPGEIAAGRMTDLHLFFDDQPGKKAKNIKHAITAALTAKPIEQARNIRLATLSLTPGADDALIMHGRFQALDSEKGLGVCDSLFALKALLGILLSQEPALAAYLSRNAVIRRQGEHVDLTLTLTPRLVTLLSKTAALPGATP